MKFVKKPVVVDAWPVTELLNTFATRGVEGLPGEVADAYLEGSLEFPSPLIGKAQLDRIEVTTLEGVMVARHGWWLIMGIRREFYPCEGDIFRASYDEVDHEPHLSIGL